MSAEEVIRSELNAALDQLGRCLALGAVVEARLGDVEGLLAVKRANYERLEGSLSSPPRPARGS